MFKIHKDWIGEGKIIQVQFKKGIYTHLKYQYNHDDVVKACEPYLIKNNLRAWNIYRTYMNGRNIPGWAEDYVQIIKP